MPIIKNAVPIDLVTIMTTFDLIDAQKCVHLDEWLNCSFDISEMEAQILDDIYSDILISGEYMNEEELRARMIALIFYAAKIDVPNKIRVFYERPLSAVIQSFTLSVVTDCMVATPLKSSPIKPYFFLQEFKKAKGEKKDPEAQMLLAMLIAQHKNNDDKPIYGGYLIGTGFHFTTLIDKNYCVSKKLEATYKSDLTQIVFILKQLKNFILNR